MGSSAWVDYDRFTIISKGEKEEMSHSTGRNMTKLMRNTAENGKMGVSFTMENENTNLKESE